ncbi:Lysine-specific demethylase JMJ32, partial [Linum grandiflorum]
YRHWRRYRFHVAANDGSNRHLLSAREAAAFLANSPSSSNRSATSPSSNNHERMMITTTSCCSFPGLLWFLYSRLCDTDTQSIWASKIEMNYKEGGFAEVIEEFKRMGSAGICCTDGVLCTVLRACGKMEDGGRTARQVHAFAMKLQGGLNGKVVIQCGLIKMDKQKMVVTLNQIHLYWEIDPSELDFSNKLCHDWDGKPLAIMALPAILNNSNNLELMWKSESEVFHIIESAITVAALRWPEKLLAQKQRIFRPYNMACRYSSTNDDGGYNSTAYNQEITKEEEEEPVYNQEITKEEEKPRRRIIRIKLVKDGKPTTATTVGSGTGATTVGSGMGANLKMASDVPWSNSEEYEKKLENSKRKLKEGYSKFEDSRKRSKVCKYISVESKNHHLVSNKVTKKAAAVTRRRSENPKARITRYSEQFLRFRAVFYPPAVCLSDRFSGMRILQRWDDALRAYTVKASQASCSGSNIRIASHEQKDHYANLYAVVSGEKHFLLLPPTDVHRMLEMDEPARYVPWCSMKKRKGPSSHCISMDQSHFNVLSKQERSFT